jgi:hypothetical protein
MDHHTHPSYPSLSCFSHLFTSFSRDHFLNKSLQAYESLSQGWLLGIPIAGLVGLGLKGDQDFHLSHVYQKWPNEETVVAYTNSGKILTWEYLSGKMGT